MGGRRGAGEEAALFIQRVAKGPLARTYRCRTPTAPSPSRTHSLHSSNHTFTPSAPNRSARGLHLASALTLDVAGGGPNSSAPLESRVTVETNAAPQLDDVPTYPRIELREI